MSLENFALVGVIGESVVILKRSVVMRELTKAEALNLAAHLVFMSGADMPAFGRVFDQLMETGENHGPR